MDRYRHAATWVKIPTAKRRGRARLGSTSARVAGTGSALSANSALALGGCALLVLIAPLLLFLAAYFYFQAFGLVYPGVKVGSTSLGGLTVKQAQQALDKSWNQRQLIASDGHRFWPAAPLDFGLWLDPQATAQSAHAIGRGTRGSSELLSILTFRAPSVNPVVLFDPG